MAHVKDLHLNIVQMVFAYFCFGLTSNYSTIHEFKRLLPPAAVCRVWRECMLPYVYRTAYLECYIKQPDKRKKKRLFARFRSLKRRLNEVRAYKKNTQPRYAWKSNIDLIVSLRLSSAIRQLRIESYRCPLNFADMVHALDTFGFSSNHWRAVNILHIFRSGDAVNDNPPSSSDAEALATQLAEYFKRHLPNISDLSIQILPQSDATELLSNSLINLYISQLHALLCFPAPITFSCHSFSSTLRRLRVGIAAGVTNRLPQLLASPLESLELFNIPHNFAWWTFIGATTDHVEFTNLHQLELQFRKPPENTEPNNPNRQVRANAMSAFDIGNRKLFFPKLKELRIYHSPYNDGALYSAFIHSPLQYVKIQSLLKSVQYMDPHILFNVSSIRFNIRSVSPDDYNAYAEFYRKLLGTPSNAKTVWLGVYNSSVPLPTPSTIEWVNIEHLTLQTNVHLASAIQIITQLPKLHTLRVENVVDDFNEASTNLQATLSERSTQTLSIATSVRRLSLCFYNAFQLPLVFSLDIMCYLTILIHSLDEVVVPDLYVSDIKDFAAHHGNAFPHLRSIKVHGKI